MSTPIIFFGNERIATGVTTNTPILHSLIAAGFTIECIILHQSSHVSGRKTRILEVEDFAHTHGIEIYIPHNEHELLEKLTQSKARIGVLAAYGKIVSQNIIDIFEYGIINLHPSLLPQFRGPTPIESFMLSDQTTTGISIMQLSKGMDDGPLFSQITYTPEKYISKQDLAHALGSLGAKEIPKIITEILNKNSKSQPQQGTPTFSQLLTKHTAKLDLSEDATLLEKKIRAYSGWPGTYVIRDTTRINIVDATVVTIAGEVGTFFVHEKQLALYCGKNALLLNRIKPEGKKEMASRDYLLGHPL